MIDAYVTGGGLPALSAALDLAEIGLRVRVCLAPTADETPASAFPREPVRDVDGALRELMERVAAPLAQDGEPDARLLPVEVLPGRSSLPTAEGWARQPEPAVLGVPAVPLSRDSFAVLGGAGAFRAFLDRLRPLLTIGKTRFFGPLVCARLGRMALARLADPFVRERYGLAPDEVETAIAAPGLNEALSRAGSLTGAVLAYSERNVARETRIEPSDGWAALHDALLHRLDLYEVDVVTGSPVEAAETPDGWTVIEADGARIEARSIVLDADRSTSTPRIITRAAGMGDEGPGETNVIAAWGLLPLRVRTHAAIAVRHPGWRVEGADAGKSAADAVADAGFLRLVDAGSGDEPERWSVRVELLEEDRWVARLAGPALDDAASAGAVSVERCDEVLRGAGLEVAPGGAWERERRAAPYATVEQRDEADRAHGGIREAHPGLLVVGGGVHGDSLPAAVTASHEESVRLRRHLVGIAD